MVAWLLLPAGLHGQLALRGRDIRNKYVLFYDLDVLLGVVPCTPAVGGRDGDLDAGDECAGEEPRERLDPEERTGDERAEHDERARRHHLLERGVGGDPDAGGVVRHGEALGEARDGVELAAHLLHHPQRRASDAPHGHRREPVGEHGAEEESHEHTRAQHVHRRDPGAADVRAEQRQRHQRRGADGEAFADGGRGVARGVERVRPLPDPVRHAGHLRDAAGVVADGPVGVDGEPRGDGAQHPQRRQRDAVHGRQAEAGVDGRRDGHDGHDHRLVTHRQAEDDVRRRARPARPRHRLHRAVRVAREVLGDVADHEPRPQTGRHADE
jgi:hypothetical protein